MIHFTSDCHFWHASRLLKHQPNRKVLGETVEEMNDSLVARWNERVRRTDEIYILGDFAYCLPTDPAKIVRLLQRLNGKKFFVFGNHDRTIRRCHEMFAGQFEWMKDYHELQVGQQLCVLSHFPMAVWNRKQHGSWMIHGHTHGLYSDPYTSKIVDVGIDSTQVTGKYEMRPFSFDEIQAYMSTRKYTVKDKIH